MRGESHTPRVCHIHMRSLNNFPLTPTSLADKLMDSDRYIVVASGRSRGSLHKCVHARSLYIYWFNLGQGKTALQHMHTLTPREYNISLTAASHSITRRNVSKATRVPAICSATVYFIMLHIGCARHSATVLCPAAVECASLFDLYNVLQKGIMRGDHAMLSGGGDSRLIWDCRLNLYVPRVTAACMGLWYFMRREDKGMMARVICISAI